MRPILLLLLLSACASPAPEFIGATRTKVMRGGIDFVVFHAGSRAEVVRMGYLSRSARAPVPGLMAEAAAAASGCRVIANSMKTGTPGDTGEARFGLDCRS